MPEMPELETIKRSLEPHIKGRRIDDVELLLSRQIKHPSPEEFVSRIKGQRIREKMSMKILLNIMLSFDDFSILLFFYIIKIIDNLVESLRL